MSAPAADAALAAALAGVAGDRGEAGATRHAFVLDGAELGHLDQQGERRRRAHAGDAHEDGEAGLQGGIGGKLRVQGGVDRGDLAIDLAQALP